MTEREWLPSTNPDAMLEHLGRAASGRKLRAFACACCRRTWSLLGEGGRAYVELAERVADGITPAAELISVAWDVAERERNADPSSAPRAACYAGSPTAATAAWGAARSARDAIAEAEEFYDDSAAATEARTAERAFQAGLLRCAFGNPYRRVTVERSWLTPDVTALARAANDERIMPSGALDPIRLAVLSDAMEEAGAGGELLAHLRSPGPHLLGCWVIDLLLGKEPRP